MWFVYIILCQDNSLYTGSTNNLEKRLKAHESGKGGKYTRARKVLKIIYSEEFESKSEGLKREAEIKSWTRTQKIKNLNLKPQLLSSK